jgi:type IV pilus assembly protein PilY1
MANFQKIVVGDIAGVLGDAPDTGGFGVASAEKKQNFANWYAYYRNRINTMKTTAGRGFIASNLEGRLRIAHQTLWGFNGTDSARGDISLMKLNVGTARDEFFDWLYGITNEGGTPLRYTMDKAGRYYQNQKIGGTGAGHGYTAMAAIASPWASVPGTTLEPELECRMAFHAILSDGSWNNDAGITTNADGLGKAYPVPLEISGDTNYVPRAPYTDTGASRLADTAFHYWITDLRTDLANKVPTLMREATPHPATGNVEDHPRNDPATWQHMVNFTVGFGVDGNLDFPNDFDALLAGTKNWTSNKVDDLWHAALNSRGEYLSAKDPQELVNAFTVTLEDVLGRTTSGTGVALNSGSLDADARLYQARFDSGDWSGQLLAFDINETNGAVITPAKWDAATELDTLAAGTGWNTNREVISFDGTKGVPFRWASLPVSMQAELNKNGQGVPDIAGSEQGEQRLEYLRGSKADEGSAGNRYRARASTLGDIVSSSPVFVGEPGFNYPNNLEAGGETYAAFKTRVANRTRMVYVGANDGMLHGFVASTTSTDKGQEKIAYVPKAVFPNLSRLTSPPYSHRFFVDGPPTAGDAFYNGLWHAVLVGGLRQGGRAIYALNVTNPANFDEANANTTDDNKLVLWEFSDADDADLGLTYARPAIVRMQNDRWAAVFGNGYNNTGSGHAVLFIVDIETGALIRKIDTLAGSPATPNGLATAAPVDVDGDRTVDYIYAGDLLGNLWKFNVRDSLPASWVVDYNAPLFTTEDALGNPQPITTQPEVGLHPEFNAGSDRFSNGGLMIYFGTGKYLETSDNEVASVQTQTFYGVWDPDKNTLPTTLGRANLLAQTIEEEGPVTIGTPPDTVTVTVRVTTDNGPIKWPLDPGAVGAGEHLGWFMDLIVSGSGDNRGERQVTTPILRGGRIIFTTLIPAGPSCVFGGEGFLMELDAADGSRLGDPPFDFDNDGAFDLVTLGSFTDVVPSGIGSTGGAPWEPGILEATGEGNEGTEFKYISGTDEARIQVIKEKDTGHDPEGDRRQSWRQLQ